MDQIKRYLWIGKVEEASETDLGEKGVDRVFNVSKVFYPDFINIPLSNSPEPGKFLEAVKKVLESVEDGNTVLVCCKQGVSRSVGVAAGVICREEGENVRNALNQVELSRPVANPSESIIRILEKI